LFAGLLYVIAPTALPESAWFLALAWLVLYGCGLHGAGFFMKRGIKLLGWICVMGGCGAGCLLTFRPQLQSSETAHDLMGIFFGLLHLACGVYLYSSEKKKTA
jgi:hypothetical protein